MVLEERKRFAFFVFGIIALILLMPIGLSSLSGSSVSSSGGSGSGSGSVSSGGSGGGGSLSSSGSGSSGLSGVGSLTGLVEADLLNIQDETTDVVVTDLIISPDVPRQNDWIELILSVENRGNYETRISWGYSIGAPVGEGYGSAGCCITLDPWEVTEIGFSFPAEYAGVYVGNASVTSLDVTDPDVSNNFVEISIEVGEVCVGDLDRNEEVNYDDVGIVIRNWGPVSEDSQGIDLNDDGFVDAMDLAMVLGSWGACV
jgi:hypothetical protein